MKKLSNEERRLLQLIVRAGGSICPGVDVYIPREGHRSLRRMERLGLVRVETTDDGPRFHITGGGRGEVHE